ncbi:response regulator [Hyphomicrobium facile]|uniref:Response regulator receiver domain-containing protein n=1 Tax=Hyphomicrobium facile TaxID=51670 RepID=A0A1I7NW93_9HYPH|nr:response regulator [Hyphomicrobium facile]SFV38919.1 Response regulator receiver domain-containing protein [Hyphomicrobium facile]
MTLKAETLPHKASETILFVDDEPLSLKYFKSSVGKYANVVTASSPEAAMHILEQAGNDISVVVSDERMPRESGVSFLSEVRKSWPSTVRVLTSAYANIDNLQHAINDAAIYRFVPKPWNIDELCTAMQDALHVERSAAAISEPVLGPSTGGDAESANIALLAILAAGLEAPLKSLDTEALQLAQLSRPSSLEASPSVTSYLGSWGSRLRFGKMNASAMQIRRDVEHCKSLAKSIGNLARSLSDPAAAPSSSMADTLSEVVEQAVICPSGTTLANLATGQDFTYRIPREIMKFVLANLLRGAMKSNAFPRVELVSGTEHNEVRIVSTLEREPATLENNQSWRTVRCALWAFGGELLSATDISLSTSTLTVCLPKA